MSSKKLFSLFRFARIPSSSAAGMKGVASVEALAKTDLLCKIPRSKLRGGSFSFFIYLILCNFTCTHAMLFHFTSCQEFENKVQTHLNNLVEKFEKKKDLDALSILLAYKKLKKKALLAIKKFTKKEKEALLLEACKKNKFEVVKILLDNNTNVHCTNKNNSTPLIYVSFYCKKSTDIEIAELLLQKKAKPNAKNIFNRTPLMYACDKDNNTLAKLLVLNGANVNEKDDQNRSPLYFACKRNNPDLAQYLIEHGAILDDTILEMANIKNQYQTAQCAICLEFFKDFEIVSITPCEHMFHTHCLLESLKQKSKCPYQCYNTVTKPQLYQKMFVKRPLKELLNTHRDITFEELLQIGYKKEDIIANLCNSCNIKYIALQYLQK